MYGTGFGTYVCTVLLTFHCNILCRELNWLVKRILLYIKSPALNTRCFFSSLSDCICLVSDTIASSRHCRRLGHLSTKLRQACIEISIYQCVDLVEENEIELENLEWRSIFSYEHYQLLDSHRERRGMPFRNSCMHAYQNPSNNLNHIYTFTNIAVNII